MSNVSQNIIDKFGGIQALATILEVNVSRVYRWTYPKSRGGTDGEIPSRHYAKILREGKKRGISVDVLDFFPKEKRVRQ